MKLEHLPRDPNLRSFRFVDLRVVLKVMIFLLGNHQDNAARAVQTAR
jgi:hypothetical protein